RARAASLLRLLQQRSDSSDVSSDWSSEEYSLSWSSFKSCVLPKAFRPGPSLLTCKLFRSYSGRSSSSSFGSICFIVDRFFPPDNTATASARQRNILRAIEHNQRLPTALNRVRVKFHVSANNWELFDRSLRHKQSVKRI